MSLCPLSVSPQTVEHYEQNRPSLVARDMEELFGVPRESTYSVLMARGVMKWLAVRRDLIALKNVWRLDITRTIEAIRLAKKENRRQDLILLRGELRSLNRCRQQVRLLCHSTRWRAPAYDGPACLWAISRGPIGRLPRTLRSLLRRKREVPEPEGADD